MPRYLMTHSLLSSWLYAIKDNPYEDSTTERNAYDDFLKVLRREPTEKTEAMQNGIDFEDFVTDIVNGHGDKENSWYDAADTVADMVKRGPLQVKASKEIEVSGLKIVLYGRLDSLSAGVIRDIKFSGSYNRGKYFNSTQHPTYFEIVPEADIFEYVISNGQEVWTERYYREETRSIIPVISDFLEWLANTGLLDIYKKKWLSK